MRTKKFISFINILCSHFAKHKNDCGIIKDKCVFKGFTNIFSHAATVAKRRKKSRGGNNQPRSAKRVNILIDGLAHRVLDDDGAMRIQCDNYNCVRLGKSKIRFGTRPQKFSKPNIHNSIKYIRHADIFNTYGIDVNRCVIIDGCYESNVHTLKRQMIPEVQGEFSKHPTFEYIDRMFTDVARVFFRKHRWFPSMPGFEFDDVYNVLLSPDKKPGYRYEEFLLHKDKASALKDAMKVAKRRWDYITDMDINNIDRDKLIPSVFTIGARGKRDYDYDDGEYAVSRAVHMPELHNVLTSAPWSDSVIDYIKEEKRGPIYIGNNILDWHRIHKDFSNTEYVLEGDWKRFDSTLYVSMVTAAVAMWRCLYDLDDDIIDKHFIAIFDNITIKDYYLIGGNVVRIYHGLPSGVKETSLLGTIMNLIAQIYCVNPINCKKYNFVVGGDDFATGRRKDGGCAGDTVNVLDYFTTRASELGMNVKFLLKKTYNARNVSECPTFYKYTVYDGKPIVPPASMLERVFMPWNKRYNTTIKLHKFLWDVMPSLGYPLSHMYLYYDLLSRTYITT